METERGVGDTTAQREQLSSGATFGEAMVTDADLHPAVAEHHVRIDADTWEDIYIVGDVHGCHDRLQALLGRIDPSGDDLLLFVGDLIRKGPDSRKVVDLVRESDNMLSVRGNNEEKVIDGRKDIPELYGVEEYIGGMPVVVSWDDQLIVHGGVDPRRPLHEQDVEELLNTRAIPPEGGYDGPFWFDRFEGPPRVFFGHTVLAEPAIGEWAVGLDTGCVYGGELTAYDYYAEECISVPGHEHEERADRKIISPSDS